MEQGTGKQCIRFPGLREVGFYIQPARRACRGWNCPPRPSLWFGIVLLTKSVMDLIRVWMLLQESPWLVGWRVSLPRRSHGGIMNNVGWLYAAQAVLSGHCVRTQPPRTRVLGYRISPLVPRACSLPPPHPSLSLTLALTNPACSTLTTCLSTLQVLTQPVALASCACLPASWPPCPPGWPLSTGGLVTEGPASDDMLLQCLWRALGQVHRVACCESL